MLEVKKDNLGKFDLVSLAGSCRFESLTDAISYAVNNNEKLYSAKCTITENSSGQLCREEEILYEISIDDTMIFLYKKVA